MTASAKSRLDAWLGPPATLAGVPEDLRRVLQANPRAVDAHVQLARYYMASSHIGYGRYAPEALERAAQELQVAYKLDGTSPDMLLTFAALASMQRNPQQALRFVDEAAQRGAAGPSMDLLRAGLFIDAGRLPEARKLLESINARERSLAPRELVRWREMQMTVYLDAKEVAKADAALRSLTTALPDYAWGHGNYAEFLLLWRGDAIAAIREAEAALAISPYPAAESILAAARYVRWANMPNRASEQARSALQSAAAIAPDPRAVMARVGGHVGAATTLRRTVEALARNGVSLDARDPMNLGSTALTLAISRSDRKSVDWLLAHGADVNAPGIRDNPPLLVAVDANDVALVKRLVRMKADVNARNASGETPLLAAAGDGRAPIAKVLLDAHADRSATIANQDAEAIARFNSHPEVAELIRTYRPLERR